MWQNIIASASLVVSIVGLVFLIAYVKATLVIADQSVLQTEVQSRPAVVAKGSLSTDDAPILVNIGNGPAIEIKWSIPNSKWTGVIPYLQQGQTHDLPTRDTLPLFTAALRDSKNEASVECKYRSLSGTEYKSINRYDFDSGEFITVFDLTVKPHRGRQGQT